MATARPPAVAGMFYPDDPQELERMVLTFLNQAKAEGPVPKAVIAPHAGYIYSGPVAASVYKLLLPARGKIERVVLIGPAHRVPFRGIATVGVDAFLTPLGAVPVDQEAISQILDLPFVQIFDEAHAPEHSLEVHLPFLQEVLGRRFRMGMSLDHPQEEIPLDSSQTFYSPFKIVPLLVGEATPQEVAEVLERLWDGEKTLIVVSSDLSHYYDYETAKRLDLETTRTIEELAPERLTWESACGRLPIAGLLLVARRKGLIPKTLDLRNSGDTAGPKDQVVGYGAYAFYKPEVLRKAA